MNGRSVVPGSLDLKRAYQKSMLLGYGWSVLMHLFAFGLILVFSSANRPPISVPGIIIDKPIDIIQPPSLAPRQHPDRIRVIQNRLKPAVGIPTPVPDNQAPAQVDMPTQQQLTELAPSTPVENLEGNIVVNLQALADEFLPSPDTFIAYEEPPVQISAIRPVYPDLARRACIEGKVWIKVLIDKNGDVRDVRIERKSGSEAGFEEAAIEAARQTVWRPAISNGQPISVWVTYAVVFKLR